jgi:hypothetical protein
MNAVIIDLESDNLYPHETQTWTICLKRLQDDARLTLNPFRMLKQEVRAKLLDFIFKYPNPIIVVRLSVCVPRSFRRTFTQKLGRSPR